MLGKLFFFFFYLVSAVPKAPQDGSSVVSRLGVNPGAQILPQKDDGLEGLSHLFAPQKKTPSKALQKLLPPTQSLLNPPKKLLLTPAKNPSNLPPQKTLLTLPLCTHRLVIEGVAICSQSGRG